MALFGSLLLRSAACVAQDTLPHVQAFVLLDENTALDLPWAETFGMECSMAGAGDVNGDGVPDMVLGYPGMDGGKGRVGIAFFDQSRAVIGFHWIGEGLGGFMAPLDSADLFGSQVASIDDLNGNGVPDVAVLAPGADDAGADLGSIHLLFLNALGEVDSSTTIFAGSNGFIGPLSGGGELRRLGGAEDLNGDGKKDLLVGIPYSDLGGTDRGAVVALMLNADGSVFLERIYSSLSSWPNGTPWTVDPAFFGSSCSGLGDVDGDGVADIAVGAPGIEQVLTILLNDNGTIKEWQANGRTTTSSLSLSSEFGRSLAFGWDVDQDGVNEIFVGDPGAELDAKAIGGVVYWDAAAEPDAFNPTILTNGIAMDGSMLELLIGSRLGQSIALLGDMDQNGVPEIAIEAPGSPPEGKRVIIIVSLNPAPIELHLTVVDESPDSLGSVDLRITGGVPPYTVQWSQELFDTEQFDNIKSSVDSVGLWTLGLTPPYQTDLTPQELLAMVEPHFVDVKAGKYWVGVEDVNKAKAETEFAVGLELLTLVEIGTSTSEDKKEVSKSSGDGWSNMQLKTKNLLPKKEDGWVRFTIPETGKTLAVGFKNIVTTDTPGYEHLECAFYFTGSTAQVWNGETLIGDPMNYKAMDVFEIARVDNAYRFSINDREQQVINDIDPAIALVINVAIYHQSGTVADITTDFRSSFGIVPTLSHVQPLSPGTGSIDLDLPTGLGPYTYTWSKPGVSGETLSSADPGEYAVTVASEHFDHTASRIYRIGHQIVWEDESLTINEEGLGTTILPQDISVPAWSKFVLSKNLVRSGAGHHIAYRPYSTDNKDHGSLVGVRSTVDGRIWAGWWVYAFGETLIAQTISRSGGVARVLVGPKDELEIVLHTYSIHFLKNGEIVHQVTRGTEGDSHLMVALHSMGSSVRDLRSTIPVPLQLNTTMLTPDVPFQCMTPDGVLTNGVTGHREALELGPELPQEEYSINVPGAPAGSEALTFSLMNGAAGGLQLVGPDSTVVLDSSLYEFRGLDELILYDEPEVYVESATPEFVPHLEKQIRMSPNGDEFYDDLRFTGIDPELTYELKVHDKASTLLFQSNDPGVAWNGRFMNTGSLAVRGTYSYELKLGDETFTGRFLVDY